MITSTHSLSQVYRLNWFEEELHNQPEEIEYLLIRIVQMTETLLTFILNKPEQLVLLHLPTATHTHTHTDDMLHNISTETLNV